MCGPLGALCKLGDPPGLHRGSLEIPPLNRSAYEKVAPESRLPPKSNSSSLLDTDVGCRIPAAGPLPTQSVNHRPATPSLRNPFKMENLNQNLDFNQVLG